MENSKASNNSFIQSIMYPFRELSNSYSIPATVVGSGDNRKNET